MKKVFSFLGFLVLLAVFSLFAVLAIRPGDFLTAYGLNESVEEY